MGGNQEVVYAALGFQGFLSAFLGFIAEGTNAKKPDVYTPSGGCRYPKSPTDALGYAAALVLLAAQITMSVVIRCACCQRKTTSKSLLVAVIVEFIFSWIVSLIGIFFLVFAASLSTRLQNTSDTGHCLVVAPGFFSGGAGLAILALIFNVYAYRAWLKHNPKPPAASTSTRHNNQHGGVAAMGQPPSSNNQQNSAPTGQPPSNNQQGGVLMEQPLLNNQQGGVSMRQPPFNNQQGGGVPMGQSPSSNYNNQ